MKSASESARKVLAGVVLTLAISASGASKFKVDITVANDGCPTGAAPQAQTCGADHQKPDRMCRSRKASITKQNANRVKWQYANSTLREPFRIEFEESSPFSDCGKTIASTGRKPKTAKCTIDPNLDVGAEFKYSVIVHDRCPLDPKIYINH